MDQRYVDLAAAIVRQAFYNAAHDYHHGRHMDAQQWLELAGLIADDGSLPYGTPRRQRNSTTTEDYNARRCVGRAAEKQRRELQEV
jgi:hypothetical protein